MALWEVITVNVRVREAVVDLLLRARVSRKANSDPLPRHHAWSSDLSAVPGLERISSAGLKTTLPAGPPQV